MSRSLPLPIIYLITSGKTASDTSSSSPEFQSILELAKAAVAAEISLFQIREKHLTTRVLYELVSAVVAIARGSLTEIMVNDRADVACASSAAGVQLTTRSLPTDVVRNRFGTKLLIGVSTHSIEEAELAQSSGADFVVFGPIFDTMSKRQFGEPQGISALAQVCSRLNRFPVVAIGGITLENALSCLEAGAAGIAAIKLFSNPEDLAKISSSLRTGY